MTEALLPSGYRHVAATNGSHCEASNSTGTEKKNYRSIAVTTISDSFVNFGLEEIKYN